MKQQIEMERNMGRYREEGEFGNGQVAGAGGHHQRAL